MVEGSDDTAVFVYTGEGGDSAPLDVVRVRVDPSVTSIPVRAFSLRKKLAEVELCEGLVEIGSNSFRWCHHSITKIVIPNSLRRINDYAFIGSLQCPICLHDDIESIGEGAFCRCIFTNFRVPLLITVIPASMLSSCRSMFSLELPHNTTEIENGAFCYCYCLRNVAIPPEAYIGDDIFIEDNAINIHTDLYQLFGSIDEMISELQHRFDGLPIHRLAYYHSYHLGVLQILIAAINMRSGQSRSLRSKLNPTGNQQDCLGMTPLHILACSSIHDLELYRVIIENYPTNLITEDRWGALPLLYALWGAAPAEINEFLLNSYQSLYPDHVFNWTTMVETMGRTNTPMESIENLLCIKQMHFPDQPIDWEYLLDQFASSSYYSFSGPPFLERLQFLVMCGMTLRVEALPFKVWRDHITNMISTAAFEWTRSNSDILHGIQERLTHFEDEIPKLKEVTSMLELVLWKIKIDNNKQNSTGHQKKVKSDESDMRRQCQVTCGADIIIQHVLLFLVSAKDEQ